MSSKNKPRRTANKNSHINSRTYGRVINTRTDYRDPGTLVAEANTLFSGAEPRKTSFVISRNGATLEFDGREFRTLYILMTKHLEQTVDTMFDEGV